MNSLELVRWALYADLGVLFGLPSATTLVRVDNVSDPFRRTMRALAILALPLTLVGFLVLVAQMSGTGIGEVDRDLLFEMLTDSALGWTFIARFAAVATTIGVLVWSRFSPRWLWLPPAVAVATLAWTGHAGASEGSLGIVRLLCDVIHLLAASTWLGALVAFLVMLAVQRHSAETVGALTRFSGTGTMLVLVLIATGLGNLTFVASPRKWAALADGPYGELMLVKLALFAAMLALATTNRFWLVPQLVHSAAIDRERVFRKLRASVAGEFLIGLTVLLLVSHLGQLDPIAV